MLARLNGRRRINDALAVVSPLAFADAVEAYVTSLEKDELRALVQRSVKRMDSSERMQFALFLGHDTAGSGVAETFSRPMMRAEEVQSLVERSDDFLPNRFAAFLRENPRAVPALGDDAVLDILGALPLTQNGQRALPGGISQRRVPARAVLIVAIAVSIAILPLVAQYVKQSGMIAGSANPLLLPAVPRVHSTGGAPKAVRIAATHWNSVHHAAARPAHTAHAAPKRIAAIVPKRRYAHTAQKPRARHVLHVAKIWKFDPLYNPYVRRGRIARARVAAAPVPSSMDPFEARARLVVNSYLAAVIAGDTTRALAHLGLPTGSDPKAISESAIITRDAKAQIVAVKPGEDGTTHVQVDIMGRRGEYFEVFSVAPDGPAVRIRDRFYIPVNRTAEEVSARLLAQKPH